MNGQAGKGSKPRPTDLSKYEEGYEHYKKGNKPLPPKVKKKSSYEIYRENLAAYFKKNAAR